jgi:hypothetical protein
MASKIGIYPLDGKGDMSHGVTGYSLRNWFDRKAFLNWTASFVLQADSTGTAFVPFQSG